MAARGRQAEVEAGAHPLRRRARRGGHRQRTGHPISHRPHGVDLRPARDRTDGRGVGAKVTRHGRRCARPAGSCYESPPSWTPQRLRSPRRLPSVSGATAPDFAMPTRLFTLAEIESALQSCDLPCRRRLNTPGRGSRPAPARMSSLSMRITRRSARSRCAAAWSIWIGSGANGPRCRGLCLPRLPLRRA